MVRVLLAFALAIPLNISLSNSTRTGITPESVPKTHGLLAPLRDSDGLADLVVAPSKFVPPIPQSLNCSPAPCVFPNVDASEGPKPVNETPVAVNPENPQQLLTSGNDWNCLPNSLQGYYSSDDGGTTWSHTCMTPLSRGSGADPAVAYDLQGNAYATGLSYAVNSAVQIQKSADNGKTWDAPQIAAPQMFSEGTIDKDWLVVDTTPTSPFANSLYVCVEQRDVRNNSLISVSHSNDGGNTWTTVAVESKQTYPVLDDACYVALGADGTIYMAWDRCTEVQANNGCGGTTASVEFSKSTDGGNTWSEPTSILTTPLPPFLKCNKSGGIYGTLPNTCSRVNDIPILATDRSSGVHKGNLYLAYSTWTGKFRSSLWRPRPMGASAGRAEPWFRPSTRTTNFFLPSA